MPKPALPVAELLAELWAEVRRGDIIEATLVDPKFHLDGLCDGTRIIIDCRPSVVETLLHEAAHRCHPRWGERRVTETARQLLAHMSTADVARWNRLYRRIVRHRSKPVLVEADE